MSNRSDLSERLLELERILAQSANGRTRAAEDTDPVTLHMAGVPVERIRRFTSQLQSPAAGSPDEVSAVTMRLLLNDYTGAVGHLRAVARMAADRIDAVALTLRASQKILRREQKLLLKRGPAATEPTS